MYRQASKERKRPFAVVAAVNLEDTESVGGVIDVIGLIAEPLGDKEVIEARSGRALVNIREVDCRARIRAEEER